MINICIDCKKEIYKDFKRCRNCAHKELWKDPKYRKRKSGENHPLYGTHSSDETRKKSSISHLGQKAWNKNIPRTEEEKRKISEANKKFSKEQEMQICKQYVKDKLNSYELAKKWNCSQMTIYNIIKRNGYSLRSRNEALKDPRVRRKISKFASTTKAMQRTLKNGYGKKCYYDNEFFPSLQERDCYIQLKKLGLKIIHNFEDRFDFLVNNKIVVEFHTFKSKSLNISVDLNGITDKQYYKNRRKLLDDYGHKDLKLVVIKDIKEIDNKLI